MHQSAVSTLSRENCHLLELAVSTLSRKSCEFSGNYTSTRNHTHTHTHTLTLRSDAVQAGVHAEGERIKAAKCYLVVEEFLRADIKPTTDM